MKRLLKMGAMVLGLAFLAATPLHAADYVELSAPQPTSDPKKIEVVELFWYGCPHCYQLEPMLDSWVSVQPEDVVFVRMPAILGPNWEILARAYYTAELLGAVKKIHAPLFKAIHEQKQRFEDEDALAKFFAAHGVNEKEFTEAFNSFGVTAKLNRAKQMTRNYGISGVPSLVINGKYRTSASEAGSHQGMLKAADRLIEQERAAR